MSASLRAIWVLSFIYPSSSSSSYSGSLVRPKVVRSVHYCPATKKTMERKYTDMTSLDAFPSSAIYPTKVRSLAVNGSRTQISSDGPHLISFSFLLDRTRRTTLWRRSSVSPSTKTTRPSRCRRCPRKPPPASCPAPWTSSWTMTWWTWSNLETECRSSEPTAACLAKREGSRLARSGEVGQRVYVT